MSQPTARELLDKRKAEGFVRWADGDILAARVERVLALKHIDYAADSQAAGYNAALDVVQRLLNGADE